MTRWKASLIHLGLSAVIYVVLLYLIVFLWYPQPYFAADGGWEGVRLITGVDLVLGPLLTLIVFRAGKPGLRRDLTLIGLLQTVALVWGTWLVYDQRTAMVTYADGSFYTLNSEQVRDIGGQAPVVAAQSTSTPPYAFVRPPTDAHDRKELRLKTPYSYMLVHQLGERYELLGKSNLPEVMMSSVEIGKYIAASEQNRSYLENFLARHGGTTQDYAFLPLHCRYQDLLLALRRTDGKIVDTLDINTSETTISNPSAIDSLFAK